MDFIVLLSREHFDKSSIYRSFLIRSSTIVKLQSLKLFPSRIKDVTLVILFNEENKQFALFPVNPIWWMFNFSSFICWLFLLLNISPKFFIPSFPIGFTERLSILILESIIMGSIDFIQWSSIVLLLRSRLWIEPVPAYIAWTTFCMQDSFIKFDWRSRIAIWWFEARYSPNFFQATGVNLFLELFVFPSERWMIELFFIKEVKRLIRPFSCRSQLPILRVTRE